MYVQKIFVPTITRFVSKITLLVENVTSGLIKMSKFVTFGSFLVRKVPLGVKISMWSVSEIVFI